MATTSSYNKKSSAVKRILSEARELSQDTSTEYKAAPLEDNIFEWHFTFRGPTDTPFSTGKYHGKIILPSEFPMRPPSVLILTPNGRWELNKKICLTFTGYHEEQWLPAWGIRTAVLGVQQFMAAKERAAVGIGSLETEDGERKRLAESSRNWTCPICQKTNDELLPDPGPTAGPRVTESLPEGLSVDSNPKPKANAEASSSATGLEETTNEAGAVQAVESSNVFSNLGTGGAASMVASSIPDAVLAGAQPNFANEEKSRSISNPSDGDQPPSSSSSNAPSASSSIPASASVSSNPPNSTSAPTTPHSIHENSSSHSTFDRSIPTATSQLRQRPINSSTSTSTSTSTSNLTSPSTGRQSNPASSSAAQRQTTSPTPTTTQPQDTGGNGRVAAVLGGGGGGAGLTGIHQEIYEQEQKIATYDRAILSVCLCLIVLFVRVLFS